MPWYSVRILGTWSKISFSMSSYTFLPEAKYFSASFTRNDPSDMALLYLVKEALR